MSEKVVAEICAGSHAVFRLIQTDDDLIVIRSVDRQAEQITIMPSMAPVLCEEILRVCGSIE